MTDSATFLRRYTEVKAVFCQTKDDLTNIRCFLNKQGVLAQIGTAYVTKPGTRGVQVGLQLLFQPTDQDVASDPIKVRGPLPGWVVLNTSERDETGVCWIQIYTPDEFHYLYGKKS